MPWPTVGQRLLLAVCQDDLYNVNLLLKHIPQPTAVSAPPKIDERPLWIERTRQLDDAIHALAVPFTPAPVQHVSEHIRGGSSNLLSSDGRLRAGASDALRDPLLDPYARLTKATAAFVSELAPIGTDAVAAFAGETICRPLIERGNPLIIERMKRLRLLYPELMFNGPVNPNEPDDNVSLPQLVSDNLFSSTEVRMLLAGSYIKLLSSATPEASKAEFISGLNDPSLNIWLSRGKTGDFVTKLSRVWAECNDDCWSNDKYRVIEYGVHGNEYIADPQSYPFHDAGKWPDGKWVRLQGKVGSRIPAIDKAILDEHVPGYPAGVRLKDLLGTHRPRVCPATVAGVIPEFGSHYAEMISDPAILDYSRGYWQGFMDKCTTYESMVLRYIEWVTESGRDSVGRGNLAAMR